MQESEIFFNRSIEESNLFALVSYVHLEIGYIQSMYQNIAALKVVCTNHKIIKRKNGKWK